MWGVKLNIYATAPSFTLHTAFGGPSEEEMTTLTLWMIVSSFIKNDSFFYMLI
jgi:hypothetical protein